MIRSYKGGGLIFLLTPLREGRRVHVPLADVPLTFLLTPLREGRRDIVCHCIEADHYFYSRPCGRGDQKVVGEFICDRVFLLTPLREGRLVALLYGLA